ncbi:cobalt-zinc-cadmium efflux system membrane fusion protein [Dysgonomonadaceae bacterium PH5-43]|nr:cobalt-zinc-cadmium efflux system membrane fusion protein [Dysgonomonadaceae bacterium PH5-43]
MKLKFICLSIITMILTGCHTHSHEHPEETHSHNTPLYLSTYDDYYEVFLEASPLAKDKPSEVTLYLTELPNTPVVVQSVTLSLIIDNKGIRQVQTNAFDTGIYKFALTPEIDGVAKILVDINSDKGNRQLAINDVMVYADAHTAEHIAEEQTNADAITFNKIQQWKIDFETKLPKQEMFGQVISTTGQIVSSQADETIIVAKTSGVVILNRNVLQGQAVSSNQELFTVSGAGMIDDNINVRLIEAQNDYIKAESDYNRANKLVEDGIVSQKEYTYIKSIYETSKVVYDNLYKNFSDKGQKVTSTQAGFIKEIFVANGEYVEAGQALASVAKNKTLLLKADVRMKYASLLKDISTANFRVLNSNKTYSIEELNGRLLSYGRSVNSDNFMLPVNFELNYKEGLVAGSFVEVFIKTKTDKEVMTIPTSALTEEQGSFFVYLQLNTENFERRQVYIGATDGISTEVLSGLDYSERVVSKGAVSVKLAQAAGALDPHAGHVH